jgi:hypothetical protein
LLPLTQAETKPPRLSSVKTQLATDQKWRPQDDEGEPMNIHIAYDVQAGVLYLHDGTHRVAAASALGINSVQVRRDIHLLHTPGIDIDEYQYRHKGKAVDKVHAGGIKDDLEQRRLANAPPCIYLDVLDFEELRSCCFQEVSVSADI